jgi:hypothetical protein
MSKPNAFLFLFYFLQDTPPNAIVAKSKWREAEKSNDFFSLSLVSRFSVSISR